MSSNDSGHIFNLNEEQKVLLREYWDSLFDYFKIEVDYSKCTTEEEKSKERQKVIESKLHKRSHMNLTNSVEDIEKQPTTPLTLDVNNDVNLLSPESPITPTSPGGKKLEKRTSFGLFRRKSVSNSGESPTSPTASDNNYNIPTYKGLAEIKLDDENILQSMKEELFYMMTCDEPDSVALRFLRARKWNVKKAIMMTTGCLQWRCEWNVRALLEIGELGIDEDVFKSGKAFIFGRDKEDRPLSFVRVRNHNKNTVPLFESEKFTLFLLETGRLSIKPPVEMCSIVFDMTDFSMNNMDYPYVKFVLHCLQNYYPECLGVCLIVNAPWIFNGCWKVIKPLLDPVVSSKVHFIKTEELKDYINDDQLMQCYGGSNPYDYEYVPPSKEDIEIEKKFKDSNNKEKFELIEEWRKIIKEYEDATKEWIEKYRDLDKLCRAENCNNPESLLKVEKSGTAASTEDIHIDNKEQVLKEAQEAEMRRKEIGEKHKKIFNKLIPYLYTKTYYQRVKTFEYVKEDEI